MAPALILSKVSLERNYAYLCVTGGVAAFILRWPAKPKIFTIWAFTGKICRPLMWNKKGKSCLLIPKLESPYFIDKGTGLREVEVAWLLLDPRHAGSEGHAPIIPRDLPSFHL